MNKGIPAIVLYCVAAKPDGITGRNHCMDRTDHAPAGEKSLHGLRMLEPGTNRSGQTLGWWRRLTTPPEPRHATFVQRERVRRAHQMSIITFFLILIDLLLIP